MKKKYLLNPYEERLGFLTGGPPNRIAIKGDLLPVALQTALQLAVRFEVHQLPISVSRRIVGAQQFLSKARRRPMASKNVDTLRAAHESWNRRNFDGTVSTMTENVSYTDHARNLRFKSRSEFKDWVIAWAKAFSDGKITNPRYLDAGDTVIAEFTVEGTNDGPFGSFAPSGRRMSLPFCEICKFDASGRVISGGAYYDQLTLLTQLGHAPTRTAGA